MTDTAATPATVGQAAPDFSLHSTPDQTVCLSQLRSLSQAHPHAEHAAEFAEAAATIDRFWEMHDLLFEHQQALDDPSLESYAARVGCDAALVDSALNGEFAARVRADFTSGVRSGVNGTPCLFINGQRYEGAWDAQSLIDVLRGAA